MLENATIDDVIDKLIFAKQLENASAGIANGKGISNDGVKRRFENHQ